MGRQPELRGGSAESQRSATGFAQSIKILGGLCFSRFSSASASPRSAQASGTPTASPFVCVTHPAHTAGMRGDTWGCAGGERRIGETQE